MFTHPIAIQDKVRKVKSETLLALHEAIGGDSRFLIINREDDSLQTRLLVKQMVKEYVESLGYEMSMYSRDSEEPLTEESISRMRKIVEGKSSKEGSKHIVFLDYLRHGIEIWGGLETKEGVVFVLSTY